MRSNLTGTTNRALRQNCAAIVCGPSLTFRVLGLGLLQDGDVGVGVFPEREEILVSRLRFGGVTLQGVGAAEFEVSKRAFGIVQHFTAMIEKLLEFRSRFHWLTQRQIGFASKVGGIKSIRKPKLVRFRWNQQINGLSRATTLQLHRSLDTR